MSHPSPLEAIFFAALEKHRPEERAAYLDEVCAGDPELRRRVERMLAAQARAGRFLEEPAAGPASTAGEPPAGEGPGTVIGPYKLLEQIGEGGFGVVFMAEQTKPVRRKVALKVLKPGLDTRQVVARFEAERQALAVMDHPNIAKVFGGGETPAGRPYFVMELVRGVPITEFCDANHLTPRQRLELLIPVCQAVQHAHQKGIIHRDIKPSNVLVTMHDAAPVPKVIDFGVAKALGQELTDKTLFTGFAQMVGTPLYMSPEQAGMSGLDVDTRSDIYSLGVLLYELLTGTTPFDKERFLRAGYDEIRRIIREEEPPPPSTRLSESKEALPSVAALRQTEPARLTRLVRGDLDWVVMKALEKDRNRRYETANALAIDLQRHLADEPVSAGPPSRLYRLRKFVRRNRWPVGAAAAVLLALVAGTAGTTWGWVEALAARDAEARERRRAVRAERDAEARRVEAVAEKERANDQAAVARAVTDFLLKDLLSQADWSKRFTPSDLKALRSGRAGEDVSPAVRDALERAAKVPFDARFVTPEEQRAWVAMLYVTAPNPTVWELLERAGHAVGGKFKDQPLTEAAVRHTLAEAYLTVNPAAPVAPGGAPPRGRPPADPIEHAERAAALRNTHLGPDHPDTLAARQTLSEFYLARTMYDPRARPKFAEAEAVLRDVIARRTRVLGAGHPDTLAAKRRLAQVSQFTQRHDQAEAMYREIIEARTAALGADHPDTAQAKSDLATAYFHRQKYVEAEPLLEELLAAPADDAEARTARRGVRQLLVETYEALGKYDRAEPLRQEMLDEAVAAFGGNYGNLEPHVDALAAAMLAQGKEEAAERLYRERMPQPTGHAIRGRLAALYEAQRNYDAAERLLKPAIDEADRAGAGGDSLGYRIRLAAVYKGQGRHEPAERLYNQAFEQAVARGSTAGRLKSLEGLADLYERMNVPARAESLRRQFAEIVRPEANKWFYVGALADLARNLLMQRKWAEAEAVLRESLAVHEKHEPDLGTAHSTKGLLGAALLGQQKYSEAEPLLLSAYRGLFETSDYVAQGYATPTSAGDRLIEAAGRLVSLYAAWGKPREAAKWRAEREAHEKQRREPRPVQLQPRQYPRDIEP